MTYQEKKQEIRDQAVEWSMNWSRTTKSWSEIAIAEAYFDKMGRRYGLLREFHENGIC